MKNKWTWIVVLVLLISIFVWSPWITKDYSEKRVVEVFEENQKGIEDGCGFNCENCGVYKSNKVLFGYEVIILV